ncbi:peroxidase P7-like [Typha angustifolia]|uniref:peroxidase P7-like n=1 Tax=Typha angustifolia TaxID=59011 RepID=UPI003C2F49DE
MAFFSKSFFTIALLLSLLSCTAHGQLSPNFYSNSCPNLESIVASVMSQIASSDPSMAAAILRLFFHDCFVNGCDASLLLDDGPVVSEKRAPPNLSVRGYEVIDAIKLRVEAACRGQVSCADILALAARDSVSLLGGPSWSVPLGRTDSTSASLNVDLPGPDSNIGGLIKAFADKGLDARDLTALSGAHTIGQATCDIFRNRIYNDANIDPNYAFLRRQTCPMGAGPNFNLAPLDASSPTRFDNAYYKNLVDRKGLLHSDQELFNNGPTDWLVRLYSSNPVAFANDFANAMVKVGNLSPSTGWSGIRRSNCRSVNFSSRY